MISLNLAKAEFSSEMGLEERLQVLSKSDLQEIKGGTTLYDSSSEDPICPYEENRGGIDGCNCVGANGLPGPSGNGSCVSIGTGMQDFSGWCPENDWCPRMGT
ncbi:hypothetical protein [Dysgonomonas alginatilytica]|nr:hypothetical protein [Dysgonomonas alginatilytica]